MPVLLAGKLTKDETTHLPLATTTNFGSMLGKTKKNLMNPLTRKYRYEYHQMRQVQRNVNLRFHNKNNKSFQNMQDKSGTESTKST